MPVSLFNRLESLANRRSLAILVAIFVGLSVVFWWVTGQLPGKAMIDAHASYTPGQVYQWITAYGEAGRSLHMVTTLTADLLYPFDYSLLCALLMIMSYRRAFPASRMARPMAVFPFVTALCDLLENICIVTLLARYPQQSDLIAQASSLFTSLKWGFLVITLTLVLVGLIGLVISYLRPQPTS